MSWWRRWFCAADEFTAPTPWVDFHCHALPNVDDGPRTLEHAVAMVKHAALAGVTHLITTVHYSDRYTATHEEVSSYLNSLREAVVSANVHVHLIAGREVTLTDQHVRAVIEDANVRIGGSTLALVELPEGLNRGAIIEGCSTLLSSGIQPVIAHPERNFMVQEAPELIAELRLRGALVQVNAGSVTGTYGLAVKRTAWHLLRQQLVDLLSSDAHDRKDYDTYVMACRLVAEKLGAAAVTDMISTTPARLLHCS